MIAAFLQSRTARLLPVGLLLVAIQMTVLAEHRPFGVALQLVLAFAVTAGAVGGLESGVLAGFVLGAMLDLGAGTPIGSSSISMGIGGLVAGTFALVNIETRWWLVAAFATLGAAVGELMVPVVRAFIGQTDVVSDRLPLIVLVVAVSSGIFSVALAPLARWTMRMRTAEWKMPAA
jgi:cell shape-determining protein MreD